MNENLKLRAICKSSTYNTESCLNCLFDSSETNSNKNVLNTDLNKFEWYDDISTWQSQSLTYAHLSQCLNIINKKKNRIKDGIEYDEALGTYIPVLKQPQIEPRINSASTHNEFMSIQHKKTFARDLHRFPNNRNYSNNNSNNSNSNVKHRSVGSGHHTNHAYEQIIFDTQLNSNEDQELKSNSRLSYSFKNMLRVNKIAQNQNENLNALLRPIESISINNETETFKRILDDSTKEKLDFIRKKFAEALSNERHVKLTSNPHQNYDTNNDQVFSRTPLLIMQHNTDLYPPKTQLNKNSIYSKQQETTGENQKFQNRKITTANDQEQQRNRNHPFNNQHQQSAPLLTVFSNFKPYNENLSVKTNNSTDISIYTTSPNTNTLATTVLPPILAGKRINLPQTQQRKNLAYLDGIKAFQHTASIVNKKTIASENKQDAQLGDPPTIK